MKSSIGCLGIVLAAVYLVGCSKITRQNYDKIEMGMPRSDVEMVLGKPTQCDKVIGTFTCVWGDPESRFIRIHFIGGRASVFSHKGLDD